MNRPLLSIALLVLCFSSGREANAQALPTATAPGAYISVGSSVSFFQSGYGQQGLAGGGVFVDINPVRAVGLEAEGRWLRQGKATKVGESTYLVGPRLQFRKKRYTPYVKTLVGLSHFNFPYGDARGRYFVLAPGGGVDLMLGESLKIRLVDLEYQYWPQFTYGTINPYGLSFGVSYRIFSGSGRVQSSDRHHGPRLP